MTHGHFSTGRLAAARPSEIEVIRFDHICGYLSFAGGVSLKAVLTEIPTVFPVNGGANVGYLLANLRTHSQGKCYLQVHGQTFDRVLALKELDGLERLFFRILAAVYVKVQLGESTLDDAHCDRALGLRVYAALGHHGANLFEQSLLLRPALLLGQLHLAKVENLKTHYRLVLGAKRLDQVFALGILALLDAPEDAVDLQHLAHILLGTGPPRDNGVGVGRNLILLLALLHPHHRHIGQQLLPLRQLERHAFLVSSPPAFFVFGANSIFFPSVPRFHEGGSFGGSALGDGGDSIQPLSAAVAETTSAELTVSDTHGKGACHMQNNGLGLKAECPRGCATAFNMGCTADSCVAQLSAALAQQDLDLEAEQVLLEALLMGEAASADGCALIPGAVLELSEQGWTLLVSYAFERRYGWSESADGDDDRAMDSLDNRSKKKINEALEQVIFIYSHSVTVLEQYGSRSFGSHCGRDWQLLCWLKEHPLARPIFQAFVVVVCPMQPCPTLSSTPALPLSICHAQTLPSYSA